MRAGKGAWQVTTGFAYMTARHEAEDAVIGNDSLLCMLQLDTAATLCYSGIAASHIMHPSHLRALPVICTIQAP